MEVHEMKFTIEQNQLLAAITSVFGVVEKRNTIPILGHVKLVASGDTLTITGTDLDIQAEVQANISPATDGQCAVPADRLKETATKLKKGSLISVELVNGMLVLKTGKATEIKLPTLPVEDFPLMTADNFTTEFQMPADQLKQVLASTSFAMSTEETRYYLNGVYLHNADGEVKAVSTDGHRLSLVSTGISHEIPGVIIPRKAVNELSKRDNSGNARVSLSHTKARFDYDGFSITTKLIDGTFPDYTRVIPRGNANTVKFQASDAQAAIGLVTVVADNVQKTKSVNLSIRDGEVEFTVRDSSTGTAREVIEADVDGGEIVIGLNSKYALDALAQADKGSVTVYYGSPLDPLRVEYDDKPDMIVVIMPTRI